MSDGANGAAGERRVWDLPVRVFHWLLLAAVIGSFVTHALGVNWFRYHVWCGYTVLVLVSFRIVWGFIGTRHARFGNFMRGPMTAGLYGVALLRGAGGQYAGHNPLGAYMVILLLLALLTQAVLGLFGNDEIYNFGPLAGYVSNARSVELTSWHRQLFWWIAGAVALHVAAVMYHRIAKRERLVRAMLTGRKPAAEVPQGEAIGSSRTVLAVVVVVVVAAVLTWIVRHAPAIQDSGSFN
jgi:cytochrome b